MKIKLFNDNILVTELSDDLVVNGVVSMYDSDNPYMFCKIVALSDEASVNIDINDILVIKRYAKEEYLPGYYFISYKDVRGSLTEEEYNSLTSN